MIAGRLASTALLLWALATAVFLLVELAPGDASSKLLGPDFTPEQRAHVVARLGLGEPLAVRYVRTLGALLSLDGGLSLVQERPVAAILAEALPATLLLSCATLALVFPLGTALGVVQAVRSGSALDGGVSAAALLVYTVPSFWLGLLLQLAAPSLGLPISGLHDAVRWEDLGPLARAADVARHLVLPTIAAGAGSTAAVARHARAAMLGALRGAPVHAARARGLPERRVVLGHALPHALLPILTLFGLALPSLVGGSVVVETIFAWPGMGRLLVEAVLQQDTPVLQGCVLLFGVFVVLGGLATDALQALLDPRVGRT